MNRDKFKYYFDLVKKMEKSKPFVVKEVSHTQTIFSYKKYTFVLLCTDNKEHLQIRLENSKNFMNVHPIIASNLVEFKTLLNDLILFKLQTGL